MIRLTENTFIHRSFKVFEEYGRIPSNGLIYVVNGTCVIMDTPVTPRATARLLDHLIQERGLTVRAVVVNHFHEDAIAGIDSVHARGIPTYGSRKTARLCTSEGTTPPRKKFGKRKVLKLGEQEIVNYRPGPGHTEDNIVTYLPDERVLFGGCLVKASGARYGNIEDAVLPKWSDTVEKVMKKFPEADRVIPGHGHAGGRELLEYTIELFAKER